MPIQTTENPANLSALSDVGAEFAIFYSSRDDQGRMWCPDCRDVEEQVQKTFEGANSPSASIIYVGQRAEWKAPADNKFRKDPWKITGVPTILRLKDGKEVGRIVDPPDIQGSLSEFVKA
ncbi:hypothetical protein PENSPDRAFT_684972 [Peniophora sp. CONT]|nr:hypothetical protein PENSPDRAFT_684972 [Peniophora sp. CONT]